MAGATGCISEVACISSSTCISIFAAVLHNCSMIPMLVGASNSRGSGTKIPKTHKPCPYSEHKPVFACISREVWIGQVKDLIPRLTEAPCWGLCREYRVYMGYMGIMEHEMEATILYNLSFAVSVLCCRGGEI